MALWLVYGPKYSCVGYVERDSYAASTLVARMEESTLDKAPIWDDLESFPSMDYREKVDILSAGIPCQPFSAAGRKAGKSDNRWLWPLVAEHIAIIGPKIIFLENVPGLRRYGLSEILGDLAVLGFNAEWDHFRASDLRAPHRRTRFFILAYAESLGGGKQNKQTSAITSKNSWLQFGSGSSGVQKTVANPSSMGRSKRPRSGQSKPSELWGNGFGDDGSTPWPPGPENKAGWLSWTGAKPSICRGVNGSSESVERGDRLRCLGNSVVPVVAAAAYVTLANRSESR